MPDSPALLDRGAIAALVPHAGDMLLLDSLMARSDNSLQCTSEAHRAPTNPLRTAAGLPASSAIEFAAQAMALHISLSHDGGVGSGYLAVCRAVKSALQWLDRVPEALHIEVCYHKGSLDLGLIVYRYKITAGSVATIQTGELGIVALEEEDE